MALFDTPRMGAAGASGDYFDYEIDQSVRLDNGPYLSSSYNGNQDKFTVSLWIKRWKLSSHSMIMSAAGGNHPGGADIHQFGIDSSDRLFAYAYESSCCQRYNIKTNRRLRDVSNWYHIVYIYDSGNSTSSDRIKLYINGELQTDLAESSYPSQNKDNYINSGQPWIIGHESRRFRYPLAAYMAELNFIDGQAYDASYFGELHTVSNQWVPKEYAGSYSGTSFYLKFANGSSLGTDSSGEGNNWSTSSLDSNDKLLDSPTNNFCTMNSLSAINNSPSFTQGNLSAQGPGSGIGKCGATFGLSSGKWYVEARITRSGSNLQLGIINANTNYANNEYLGSGSDYAIAADCHNQKIRKEGSDNQTSLGGMQSGDILGFAIDMNNGTFQLYCEGSTKGSQVSFTAANYNPVTFAQTTGASSSKVVWNFGQDSSFAGAETAQGNQDANGYGDFYYSPPSGFLAVCSANLSNPSIKMPNKHFKAKVYTPNSSNLSVTGYGFQPDLLWFKSRTQAYRHYLFDVVRGTGQKALSSHHDAAEGDDAGSLTSFDSDGWTTSGSSGFNDNGSGTNGAMSWAWKAGGSASSNSDGSTTSSVSANPSAGFSIVSYTGTGSATSFGHGLGVAPKIVIFKKRNAAKEWFTYTKIIDGSLDYFKLDTTDQKTDSGWSTIVDSSSVLTMEGSSSAVNGNGDTYIAYCFSEVEGYSKISTYIGNGSSNGQFVHTGFQPALVITKGVSGSNWYMWDPTREGNPMNSPLQANDAGGEPTNYDNSVDILSNGFKLRASNNATNGNGNTYIYLAFAEHPFKYSNAN